jgi:hypothetical protein
MHLILGQFSIVCDESLSTAKTTTKRTLKVAFVMTRKAASLLEKEWKEAA